MKKTDKRTEKFEVREVELRKAGGLQGAVGKIRRWAGHGARMRLGAVDRCAKKRFLSQTFFTSVPSLSWQAPGFSPDKENWRV
jgi:hypothetical protein